MSEILYAVCNPDLPNQPKFGNEFALYTRGEIERGKDTILSIHHRDASAGTRLAFREATKAELRAFRAAGLPKEGAT